MSEVRKRLESLKKIVRGKKEVKILKKSVRVKRGKNAKMSPQSRDD